MGRHAYLIMAHNNFDLLKKLMELLDDKRNDIYLHIDIKAGEIDKEYLNRNIKFSKIHFVKRMDVKWAAYSGVECEMNMLSDALLNGPYDYYHLLSGADLPIKNQDEIHKFFDENKGTEFVEYDDEHISDEYMKRVEHYYWFQDVYGRNRKNPIMAMLYVFDNIFDKLQGILHVNRVKNEEVRWQKGPNWFSITQNLAYIVVDKKEWVKKTFQYTRSGDELFLQTILNSGPCADKVFMNGVNKEYSAALRKIDWTRGKPYTWREEDYDELMSCESNCMFARKFDSMVDEKIIERIYTGLIERKQ